MARFTQAGATPTTIDVILRQFSMRPYVPGVSHRTAGGARMNYIVGTRARSASLTLMVTTATEHDQWWSFFYSAKMANTRFTFVKDPIYRPSDTWSAFFISEPEIQEIQSPFGRIVGEISVDIEDVPVAL